MVVHYEDLCVHPEREFKRILARLGTDCRESDFDELAVPSMTSRDGSVVVTGGDLLADWSNALSPRQVRNILEIVDRFGLSHLYGESATPASRGALS